MSGAPPILALLPIGDLIGQPGVPANGASSNASAETGPPPASLPTGAPLAAKVVAVAVDGTASVDVAAPAGGVVRVVFVPPVPLAVGQTITLQRVPAPTPTPVFTLTAQALPPLGAAAAPPADQSAIRATPAGTPVLAPSALSQVPLRGVAALSPAAPGPVLDANSSTAPPSQEPPANAATAGASTRTAPTPLPAGYPIPPRAAAGAPVTPSTSLANDAAGPATIRAAAPPTAETSTGSAAPSSAASGLARSAPAPGPAPAAAAQSAPAAAPVAASPGPPPLERALAGLSVAADDAPSAFAPSATASATTGTAPTTATDAQSLNPAGTTLVTPSRIEAARAESALTQLLAALSDDTSGPLPAFASLARELIQGSAAPALARLVPTPGPTLAAQILLAGGTLERTDAKTWFGDAVRTAAAKGARGRAALDAAASELDREVETTRDGSGGVWRSLTLPFQAGQAIEPIRLHLHRPPDEASSDGETRARRGGGTRFLLDIRFSRLGPVQFDGLVREQRIDLVLRSPDPLDPAAREAVTQIFEQEMLLRGLAGTIGFRAEPPLEPDRGSARRRGIVA